MWKSKAFKRSHKGQLETSLGVQRLRLHTPNAGGPGLIPGQGTRCHMPQLKVQMLQLVILSASTRTGHNQKKINKGAARRESWLWGQCQQGLETDHGNIRGSRRAWLERIGGDQLTRVA